MVFDKKLNGISVFKTLGNPRLPPSTKGVKLIPFLSIFSGKKLLNGVKPEYAKNQKHYIQKIELKSSRKRYK